MTDSGSSGVGWAERWPAAGIDATNALHQIRLCSQALFIGFSLTYQTGS
jgi:hypothetical protein